MPYSILSMRYCCLFGFSEQDADESDSGNPIEGKLVDLDFSGVPDVPVSTLSSLEQILWSQKMNEILRAYVLPPQVPGPPLCVLEPRGLLLTEPIEDMLQYSQKDLDALVRKS